MGFPAILSAFQGQSRGIIALEGAAALFEAFEHWPADIERSAAAIAHRVLDDGLDLMRSRVPVDSGLLLNGITGEVGEGFGEFRASARRNSATRGNEEDYAHFVEFGTASGVYGARAAIDQRDGLFSIPADATSAFPTNNVTSRARQQYRSHPGTPAQPFFYDSAQEAFDAHAEDFAAIGVDTGRALGFES
jgi:hypothetical protein